MASNEEFLEHVLDQLRDMPSVSHRKMMGEYVFYADDVVFGGVYDNRFLLKDVPAARAAFLGKAVEETKKRFLLQFDIANGTV